MMRQQIRAYRLEIGVLVVIAIAFLALAGLFGYCLTSNSPLTVAFGVNWLTPVTSWVMYFMVAVCLGMVIAIVVKITKNRNEIKDLKRKTSQLRA